MTDKRSKIEKLIVELCPNGVEFKELGEITAWDKRFKGISRDKQQKTLSFNHVSAKDLKDLENSNGRVKLLATGQFDGWTTEELADSNLNNGEVITIPSGGSANLKYYKGKFVDSGNILGSSIDEKILNLKYCYYYLLTKNDFIESNFRGSGVKHPDMARILSIKIPLSTLTIQEEIVKILNSFTELEAELMAELEARKTQYHYYKENLLTFTDDIKRIAINDLCNIGDGLHGTPKYNDAGNYYFINGNNLKDGKVLFDHKTKKVDDQVYEKHGILFIAEKTVFMSINGTIGNVSLFNNENIVLGKSVAYFNIKSDLLDSKFLFYFLQTKFAKRYYDAQKTGATIKNLGLKSLRGFKVPLPPISEQRRLAHLLAKFDALVSDISIGLPAELNARRQQYEYYRNKLLTFNEYVE